MKQVILSAVLSLIAIPSIASTVQVIENPFDNKIEIEPSLFVKAKGGAQCKDLPRTCSQMSNCEQAKQALKCGNKRLDRDKDGVPCESICPGV